MGRFTPPGGGRAQGIAQVVTNENLSLPDKDTEDSITLTDIKKFEVTARLNSKFRVAFAVGDTNVSLNYREIKPGASWEVDDINDTITVYFQASKDAEIIQITKWSM